MGFTSAASANDGPSIGISYFEGWDDMTNVDASHGFVVTGERSCVEVLYGIGVVKGRLDLYIDDPALNVFFRKPHGYTELLGQQIAELAYLQVGNRHDHLISGGISLRGSFFGHFATHSLITDFNPFTYLTASRLSGAFLARCMRAQPASEKTGILAREDYQIDLRTLFEDREIFADWGSGAIIASSD